METTGPGPGKAWSSLSHVFCSAPDVCEIFLRNSCVMAATVLFHKNVIKDGSSVSPGAPSTNDTAPLLGMCSLHPFG